MSVKLLFIGEEKSFRNAVPASGDRLTYEAVFMPNSATDEELIAAGQGAAIIIADAMKKVSGDVIRALPTVKMIHSQGVGYQGIDVEAATEIGAFVCNCRGINAGAVAEHAILLMLGLLRDVKGGDRAVREGRQIEVKTAYMKAKSLRELGDCTVGLLGFGAIGRRTAKIASACGARVLYYARHRAAPEEEAACSAEYCAQDQLLKESDIVSLHLPLSDSTFEMVNRDFFAGMKRGAYLINTARGELVKSEDLLDAIRSGQLAGAGLDTIPGEPVGTDNPLLLAEPEVEEKLLLSCHIAGITGGTFRRSDEIIRRNIEKAAAGEVPDNVVNDL